jgi:hypothetical protein
MKTDKRPVFPPTFHNDGDRNVTAPDGQLVPPGDTVSMPGITVRQLYAGMALQGYIAASSNCTACGPLEPPEFASAIGRDSWIMADALIATEHGQVDQVRPAAHDREQLPNYIDQVRGALELCENEDAAAFERILYLLGHKP